MKIVIDGNPAELAKFVKKLRGETEKNIVLQSDGRKIAEGKCYAAHAQGYNAECSPCIAHA